MTVFRVYNTAGSARDAGCLQQKNVKIPKRIVTDFKNSKQHIIVNTNINVHECLSIQTFMKIPFYKTDRQT